MALEFFQLGHDGHALGAVWVDNQPDEEAARLINEIYDKLAAPLAELIGKVSLDVELLYTSETPQPANA